MWRMEDVLSELKEEEGKKNGKGMVATAPAPGFRFHPTDEELITFYLASKLFHPHSPFPFSSSPLPIAEVDLNRCEPWDLPERARMGEREWYFYSLRDRKYPTGLRTNRATGSGYWKATGKDRQVFSTGIVIGMKKTLVFYQGRAPRGVKTRWVMHEYRLDGHFSTFRLSSKEEWVMCRIFQKHGGSEKQPTPTIHPSPTPPPSSSPFLHLPPPTPVNPDSNSPLDSFFNHPSPLHCSALSNAHSTTTTTAAASIDPLPSSILFHLQLPLSPLTATATATSVPTVPVSNPEQQQWLHKMNYPQLSFEQLDAHAAMWYNGPTDEHTSTVHIDMSASAVALDRLLHPPIKLPPESWPSHHIPDDDDAFSVNLNLY